MSEKSEYAVEHFLKGFNCAQAVLSAFSEKYGMKQEDADRIATGFGGEIRCGEVCGAVTGGVLVIGLKYGNDHVEQGNTKLLCYEKTVEFTKMFQERKGSIVCRQLLHYDLGDPEQKNKQMNLVYLKRYVQE